MTYTDGEIQIFMNKKQKLSFTFLIFLIPKSHSRIRAWLKCRLEVVHAHIIKDGSLLCGIRQEVRRFHQSLNYCAQYTPYSYIKPDRTLYN